ncbi:hypothetical protein BDF19DRAFT_441239 [Syncephalis fuscata]|nr:hypothetical protein BDF19DRAFT_441239 [Syncephalis fuscata]
MTTMSSRDSLLIFDKELHALLGVKPPIKTAKVEQLTQLAVRYANNYKAIVYSVERFIRKCPREYRLSGLYLIDSICRQGLSVARKLEAAQKISRQELGFTKEYAQRFARDLSNMVHLVIDSGELAKEKGKKLIDIWEKFETFDSVTLEKIRHEYFSDNVESTSNPPSINQQQQPVDVNQILQSALQQNPQLISMLQTQLSGLPTNKDSSNSNDINNTAIPSQSPRNLNDPLNYNYDDDDDDIRNNDHTNYHGTDNNSNNNKTNKTNHQYDIDNMAVLPLTNLSTVSHMKDSHIYNNMNSLPSLNTEPTFIPFTTTTATTATTANHNHPHMNVQMNDQTLPVLGLTDHQGQTPSVNRQETSLLSNNTLNTLATILQSTSHSSLLPALLSSSTASSVNYNASIGRVQPDVSIDKTQLKVLGRTLYVGGIQEQIMEHDLNERFGVFGIIDHIEMDRSTATALVTMNSHAIAKQARESLRTNATLNNGLSIKVGWRCAFGPKSRFDFQQGHSIIPLNELTLNDQQYLRDAPVGGYDATITSLIGGVSVEEPGEQAQLPTIPISKPTILYQANQPYYKTPDQFNVNDGNEFIPRHQQTLSGSMSNYNDRDNEYEHYSNNNAQRPRHFTTSIHNQRRFRGGRSNDRFTHHTHRGHDMRRGGSLTRTTTTTHRSRSRSPEIHRTWSRPRLNDDHSQYPPPTTSSSSSNLTSELTDEFGRDRQ